MATEPEIKQIFNEFCEWLKRQYATAESSKNVDSESSLEHYREDLRVLRMDEDEIALRLKIVREVLFKIDTERWNRFYDASGQKGDFQAPNKFMAGIIDKIPVGTALDIGMGQGRNALFLARKGWTTTGLEASKQGVETALREAAVQNLKITAIHTDYEKYDLGLEQWDLILLLYVPFRNITEKIVESLTRNGRLIVEAFHTDSRRAAIVGDKVSFNSNELLESFKRLDIYFYEETTQISDFGNAPVPIIRLYAGKPPGDR